MHFAMQRAESVSFAHWFSFSQSLALRKSQMGTVCPLPPQTTCLCLPQTSQCKRVKHASLVRKKQQVRLALSWQEYRLGPKERRALPACACWAIWEAYPSANGVYRGFRFSRWPSDNWRCCLIYLHAMSGQTWEQATKALKAFLLSNEKHQTMSISAIKTSGKSILQSCIFLINNKI